MFHFFAPGEDARTGTMTLTGPDVRHIRVLRLKAGDRIRVSDCREQDSLCEITELREEQVLLRVLPDELPDSELSVEFILFQGLPKADKMELITEKAVELGVNAIVPVQMHRSVVKLEEKKKESRRQRLQSIAEAAAKQSKRRRIPSVEPVLSFQEALLRARELDALIVPYECAEGMEQTRQVLSGFAPGRRVGIWIGPEGGFEDREIAALQEAGGVIITLGPRILRTETAGPAVLAMCGLYY